jgi:hypothetical protein
MQINLMTNKSMSVLTADGFSKLARVAIASAILASSSFAADNIWTGGAGSLNWNVNGNWSQGGVPQADPFEEEGVIENGATVFIAAPVINAAGIRLGGTAATTGGLEVRSGGSISVVDSSGTPNGTVSVGVNGQGTLAVQPGGSLSAQILSVNGQSSLTVGGTGGVANLAVANGATLNGATRITGGGHTISTGSVTLGGTSSLVADIRSASHSAIRSTGVAALNGAFDVEFGGGYVPTVGSSWNIVDAVGITGQFSSVDLSGGPALGPGQVFRLARRTGGTNGQLLQLQYRNVLTLNVDWDSKAVSISSPSGEAIAFDGYSILSNSGGLSTSLWSSLQDQAASGWMESTPTNTALNELNQNLGGSLSINATPRGLGNAFNPVIGALGQSPEDLRFEYTIPSTGEIVEGLVNYTGNRIVNNLALIVDPTTGKAQLKNSTPNPLSFDGYSILSNSNSLLPADGKWSSLADQGTVPWQEANAATNWLNELRTSGFTTLAAGQSLNLGELFNKAGGIKDLVLEFALQGELGPRLGTVIYAALATAVPGDYNGNGTVDAADYTVWRDSLGANGSGLAADGNGDNTVNGLDYAYWKTRFGNTSGSGSDFAAGAGNVPEPSTFAALCVAIGMAAALRRSDRGAA